MENKINEKIDKGYSLDLGKVIDDSFEIFKKTFLISGLGFLLTLIVVFILAAFFGVFIYGITDFANFATELDAIESNSIHTISSIIFLVLLGALFAPINAGFLKLCYLAKKNQALEVGTIFDYYKGKYAKDIIIGSTIISFVSVSLSTLFDFMNLSFMNFILEGIIGLFTVFFFPLIIFGGQSFGEAIEKSIKLVAKQPIYIFAALVIAVIGVLLGIIALCIGIIFTVPYWWAMIFALYDNGIGTEEENIIDEIGTSEFKL